MTEFYRGKAGFHSTALHRAKVRQQGNITLRGDPPPTSGGFRISDAQSGGLNILDLVSNT